MKTGELRAVLLGRGMAWPNMGSPGNRRKVAGFADTVQDWQDFCIACIEAAWHHGSIRRYYTRGVILIISNPVDILTYKAAEWMDLPNGMVFGSGCILDTSRFVRSIADYIELSTGVINGYVVGEHGDGQVPIWSRVTVGGIPIDEFCAESKIAWNEDIKSQITQQTKEMGSQIIAAKGRTHYGIATCVCQLADAVINQRPTIVSVSSVLMGEHGCRGAALSVPSVVGPAGVQLRIREKWAPEEYRGFFDAVEKMRKTMEKVED